MRPRMDPKELDCRSTADSFSHVDRGKLSRGVSIEITG
jgi:hypothetical protein